MDTYVTVAGNLTADPTRRVTASGATVVHLRVASSGRKFDRATGSFRDGDPIFITVSCWRTMAANVFASLRKGDSVIVHGRLTYRSYDDKQGARRNVHEIDAIAVGPDLARCPVEVQRLTRVGDPVEGRSVSEGSPLDSTAVPQTDEPSPVAA